jgi:hypothetical protein
MTDDAQLGPDMSRYRWIWVEREKDLKWLRSRLGADKDPWIQAQIAKVEAEIAAKIAAEIERDRRLHPGDIRRMI